jgi:hypothetical protein
MGYNGRIYEDPEVFRLEQFLGASPEPLPTGFVFGYGRRLRLGFAL